MLAFQPDYRHLLAAVHNRRPDRLPLYEHIISPSIMEQILGVDFASLWQGDRSDQKEFFTHYCRFFRDMTYDTVSFEVCIVSILPDGGAILGGRPGPIQSRKDFEAFPWDHLAARYWALAESQFDILAECIPPGMKAVGGVGNGPFEISEDLVGFEYLAYLMADDPDLIRDLYLRIGDLMVELWARFLDRYGGVFAVCRFGDDLGFKTSTLVSPATIRKHIFPQYRRVIDLIHHAHHPFLWHSCGNIFALMEDAIALGIDAKHSNEDVIAPFERWITLYGDRIGLLGGIDVDLLCLEPPAAVRDQVIEMGAQFRRLASGYALGSGNSIPDYVPVAAYLAMVEAAQSIRHSESHLHRRPSRPARTLGPGDKE